MSDDNKKKETEIQILKKVFGEKIDYEESEQPDFILKYGETIKHGVEITELYYDGTSARIKKGGYVKDLIEKEKYLHKDDKKKLKVREVTYYSKEKNNQSLQIPMLFLPKYTVHDYAKAIIQTIKQKNKKLKKYSSDISKNCILVIYDKENPFKNIDGKDFAKSFFSTELIKLIRESEYEDIYLVTDINNENKYVSLKSYLLYSDFLVFMEFINEKNIASKLENIYSLPLFAFAEMLVRRGCTVTFCEVDNDEVLEKVVLFIGRYGLGMITDDNNWRVGIFDNYPLYVKSNNWKSSLEQNSDFFDNLYMEYEEILNKKVASIGMFFSTTK